MTRDKKMEEIRQNIYNFAGQTDFSKMEVDLSDLNDLDKESRSYHQKKKTIMVKSLQEKLKNSLEQIEDITWQTEKNLLGNAKDRVDIFGSSSEYTIILEIDTHRADQIAKKFTSRLNYFLKQESGEKDMLYVIFIYPGTKKMSINETKKYIRYCKSIGEELHISVMDFHTSDLDEKWGE